MATQASIFSPRVKKPRDLLVKSIMLFLVAWAVTFISLLVIHFMLNGGINLRTLLGLVGAFLGFAVLFAGIQLPLLLLLRRWKKKSLTGRWYVLAAVLCGVIPVLIIAEIRAGAWEAARGVELVGWCFSVAVFGIVVGNGFYRGYDCGAERR